MHIRYGYTIEIEVSQPTTILTAMDVEPARRDDIIQERALAVTGVARVENYTDGFGNLCRRIEGLSGTISLSLEGLIQDSGLPDQFDRNAIAVPVAQLPVETLSFLLAHPP